MKFCTFLLVFLLVILTSASKAQIQPDTPRHYVTIDTTDYFPTKIGNYWEYRATTLQGYSYWGITAVGDTLMPNGKHYIHFSEKDFGAFEDSFDWYYRKDSNAVYIYARGCIGTNEFKQFDLTPSLKDSTVWEICRNGAAGNAIGVVKTFYDYRYYDWFQRPVEARIFDDVRIDTINGNIWLSTDASTQMALLKGIGMVYELVFGVGEYYLRGAIINGQKFGTITSVESEKSIIPGSMRIQAYPNPFNSTVNLNIELKTAGMTELMVFNMLGQKVATIFEDYKPSGNFKFSFNADHLSSGVYFVLLKQNQLICKEKIILLK